MLAAWVINECRTYVTAKYLMFLSVGQNKNHLCVLCFRCWSEASAAYLLWNHWRLSRLERNV